MRLLVDENMSRLTVSLLRASGHDVLWVREERPSSPDPDVLEWATRESRLLITFDTDFGEINQRDGNPAPFGIILFRIAEEVPSDEAARLITQNVNAQVEWPGYLWAMTIRKRPSV